MTMKELCSKFMSLLHYVPYIIDEKPKIKRFLSCLPIMFKKRIEYDNPKTLEEAMRKENLCYDQNKNKRENVVFQVFHQLCKVRNEVGLETYCRVPS